MSFVSMSAKPPFRVVGERVHQSPKKQTSAKKAVGFYKPRHCDYSPHHKIPAPNHRDMVINNDGTLDIDRKRTVKPNEQSLRK